MHNKAMLEAQSPGLAQYAYGFMRRALFKRRQRDSFNQWQKDRQCITADGYSLKFFDEYRCIFVHVPKCAGMAVSQALFHHNGGAHRTIREYQLIFSPWEFMHYFKFTIVRNPWDRLLSAFKFLKMGGMNEGDKQWAQQHLGPYKEFNSFVCNWLDGHCLYSRMVFVPQMKFLRLPTEELGVNFIGAYESLEEDFHSICSHLRREAKLLRMNASYPGTDDYRRHYTDKACTKVAELYADDIQTLGYSFDNQPPLLRQRQVESTIRKRRTAESKEKLVEL